VSRHYEIVNKHPLDHASTFIQFRTSSNFEHVLYSPLVQVDIGLLADQVGETTTNTLDVSQGVHDLTLTINVGVEETQDVLELVLVRDDDGRLCC
jgi:hypothetical protein